MLQAGLTVERDIQVGGFLEGTRLDGVLHLDVIQNLAVVERRVVGIVLTVRQASK